ncbi:MAG: hypothetical protein Q9222_000160 [Ikaeria aurantiellina]
MPDLRHTALKLQLPDGSRIVENVTDENLAYWMSILDPKKMQLAGEDGDAREDTIQYRRVVADTKMTLDELFDAWSQLRLIVAKYENTINKRWAKKTATQRKAILLQAWPHMSPSHRPDMQLWHHERRMPGYHKRDKDATRNALRFPHISIEDMSQPKNLLLMINSRSRNFPATFANADCASLRIGIRSKMLEPHYLRNYAMYLSGEHTREGYGRIVEWKEDVEAIIKCWRGIAFDPGMGLMVLEIQRHVLRFLVQCSTFVMHDVYVLDLQMLSPAALDGSKMPPYPVQPKAKPLEDAPSRVAESSTAYAIEAPYQAPDMFEFTRLKNLVEAKCQEAEDSFLLIQEDPGYFADLMQEARGHTRDAVTNSNYRPGLTLPTCAWNEAVYRVLGIAFHDAILWDAVSRLFGELVTAYVENEASIRSGNQLPTAYVQISSRLGHILDTVVENQIGHLPIYLSAVPTFREQITNTIGDDGKLRSEVKRKSAADRLFWLFTELVLGAKGKNQICGLANLLQELELLIIKDRKEKKRLTWRLIRLISDLAVVGEIQRQLGLSTCNEYTLSAFSQEDNDEWCGEYIAPWIESNRVLLGSIGQAQERNLGQIVTDLKVFEYPVDKPPTVANTAKMRSAEDALAQFWEHVEERFVQVSGKTLQQLLGNRIRFREVRRTPVSQHYSGTGAMHHRTELDMDVSLALAILEQRSQSTVEPTALVTSQRQKGKRRAAMTDELLQEEIPDIRPSTIKGFPTSSAPKVVVKRKAFNTFTALFGGLLGDTLPGELPWVDFKKAMVNIGFSAEKLQGSAWLFASTLPGRRGSIIFHEPHPESKLPKSWCRRIARRLNRNFGWTAATFEVDLATSDENKE